MAAGRAGPKPAADLSPLPGWEPDAEGAARFALFCQRYVLVPKGTGAKDPFVLRPWQVRLVSSLLDSGEVALALWVLARGQGKSTLTAALAVHHLFDSGMEGARAVVVAQDERSSMRMLATATRMVELNPELEARCTVYRDRLVVPRTDSQMLALPGESHRIEGEDASLAICDEIGFVRRDAFESLLHSTGKRPGSKLLAIGTPSPPSWRDASPMLSLVLDGRARPDDPSFALVEYAGDITHPVDCPHCLEAANPGLDDLLQRSTILAALPPRTRESEFRRARLGEWVDQDDASFLPLGAWDAAGTGEAIPSGTPVVLSLDGSFSGDATALVATTVSKTPHQEVVGVWQAPDGADGWRVPVLEVEEAIRQACKHYRVVELTADPFRWQRSLQVVASEGVCDVTEFPQSPARMTAATTDYRTAVLEGELTHSGDPVMALHVANATVVEDARGVRLAKEKRNSPRRIDLAVAGVMGHSRAVWRASRPEKKKKARSFA